LQWPGKASGVRLGAFVSILASGGAEAHDGAVHGNGSAKLQFGAVTLIPGERLVLKDGRAVPFTPKAFDLLVVLAENPGRLLTKEQLMHAVWPDTAVEESNLAYHVFAIRKALGESADADRYIETVPKSGYRFVAPVMQVAGDGRLLEPGHDGPMPALHGEADVLTADPAGLAQSADSPTRSRSSRVRLVSLGIGGGLMLGFLVFAFGLRRAQPDPSPPVHFQEPVTGRLAQTGMFSVSPDGRHLVYASEGTDGILRLWARTMGTLQPVAMPGTEVFTIIPPAFWSPDSRFVAFDPGMVLKKASLDGGAAQSVCDLPTTGVGGSWSRSGDILVGSAFGALVRCPAAGGTAATVTGAALLDGDRHIFPSFLSDGRRFIYLRVSRTNPETSGIYAGELGVESSPGGRRLITTGFGAAFVPAVEPGPGFVVFARDNALFAQRFDEDRLEMMGNPVRLADRIGSFLDGAFFSVSPTTLVYRAPEPDAQLVWFDREGREVSRVGAPARFSSLALSPDGNRAVLTTQAPAGTVNADLWLFELSRSANPRRVTFEPALEFFPVWSDSDHFAYGFGGGASGVYQQTVSGERRLLFTSAGPQIPTSMSPDGRVILYTTITGSATRADVWVRSGDGGAATATPFLFGAHDQSQAQLSPDQRWVAYVSNEGGPNEVFLTEFRVDAARSSVTAGESIRISEGGGFSPRWRGDGRELYYLTPDGSVMALDVDPTRGVLPRTSRQLFTLTGVIPEWGVAPDGNRFLFAVPLTPPPPFEVVLNWQSLIPKQD
jgi:DNA-binding winged helix-turn-helix (wHTH) protein/Tol biopolymer transport system component